MLVLEAMFNEEVDPLTPRFSLRRTPPPSPIPMGETTPLTAFAPPQISGVNKRLLTSPEEVQEAVRRRTAGIKGPSVPPFGSAPFAAAPLAVASSSSAAPAPVLESQSVKSQLDKSVMLEGIHAAVKGIGAVANATNKLNITDKTTIAGHGQDILAMVGQLMIRVADLELELSATKLRATEEILKANRCAGPLRQRVKNARGQGPNN